MRVVTALAEIGAALPSVLDTLMSCDAATALETARRMASVATTPPPPSEEDLEQLAKCVMYAGEQHTVRRAAALSGRGRSLLHRPAEL